MRVMKLAIRADFLFHNWNNYPNRNSVDQHQALNCADLVLIRVAHNQSSKFQHCVVDYDRVKKPTH